MSSVSTAQTGVFQNGIVLPKTAGLGTKVDPASPTFPWRDLKGPVFYKDTGPSSPTLAVFRGGSFRKFFFGVGNVYDTKRNTTRFRVIGARRRD